MATGPLTRDSLEPLRGNPDSLIDIILRQAGLIAEQQELIARQQEAIEALEKRVSFLEKQLENKGGGGGAAPFRVPKEKRQSNPKKPGRGMGHPGRHRPKPSKADLVIEVPLGNCPDCGGPIEETVAAMPQARA